jgi:hypothetical protein
MFKVPEAKRFTNAFCATCGSRLPRQAADAVIVPAGSLDDDSPLKPTSRIFYDSRAPWSCGDHALPVHAEYPPQA